MGQSRRTFLQSSAAAAAALALNPALSASEAAQPKGKGKSLRILILGGTGFLGPATVDAALARGHEVTIFHRGKTRPGMFKGKVTEVNGDRDPKKDPGLKALESGTWDAVIDNSGYYPRIVKASAELLASRTGQYVYISSISCYKEPSPMNGDETSPLATLADPTVETMGKQFENYGGLKALCEQAVEAAMPGRATIVRPGYIVGPDDPTGRYTFWPVRADKGGEMAIPGAPSDPIQIIDVRDLGEWLVRLCELKAFGAYNACGPAKKLSMGELVASCVKAAAKKPTLTWIPAAFIVKQEGVEFPIWAPFEGDTKGFHTWKNDRAIKTGLRFRPVEQTAKDTLAWFKTQEGVEKGRTRLAGPTAEVEAKLLEAWKASQAKPKA
ncbi:MAG: twin-arginine translocation signal domain-containing protein [Holophagaceae bacterium]|nr:twin-arginine translocation signal domain-containing protein [Holophagaceae bacterium]